MNKPWKEVTIYDIAEKLDLSASTVSRALNNHPIIKEKTRKLVQATAEAMNFEFNLQPGLATPSSKKTIGVVLPSLNEELLPDIVAGIAEMADQLNYSIIFAQSQGLISKETELVKDLFRKGVDGLLICLAYEKEEMAHFAKYQRHQIPVCSFHKVWNHPNASHIQINNFKAAYELTSHLIDEGCRNIAHVTFNSINNIYLDRLKGYKEALNDKHLDYHDKLIYKADLTFEGGQRVASRLLALDRFPNALIFNSDISAISCMNVLKKHGVRIPEDISIASFNNQPFAAACEPALTSVDIQGYQMGQMALAQLVNQIKLKGSIRSIPFRICLEHTLVIRNSSLRNGLETGKVKAIR